MSIHVNPSSAEDILKNFQLYYTNIGPPQRTQLRKLLDALVLTDDPKGHLDDLRDRTKSIDRRDMNTAHTRFSELNQARALCEKLSAQLQRVPRRCPDSRPPEKDAGVETLQRQASSL